MRLSVRGTSGLVLIVLATACSRTSTAVESPIPTIAVEKFQLANGLDVVMVEDHRLPRIAIDIWYHVGPVNEEPGRTGFAHLFEHMMFQKSKHVPEDAYFRTLEAVGASDINGTTDQDRTNYFETVPSNQLETALWLESDRMGYLLDEITADSFKNQQDVVRNERRQSLENRPYGIVGEAVTHTLFPKDHPYYADVIGSHQDIQAAQVADARRFFRQYYSPNNASIAIVGAIDKAKTRQLVEKYFGPLKRGPEVPSVKVTTPEITAERRVVVKDHIELPRLYIAWITPPIFKPGDAEAQLAANILGQGKSSRLYRSLVYEKQIAQDVAAYTESFTLGSKLTIQATARDGHTLEEIEQEIDAQLDAFRMSGPTAQELDRAKASTETGILFSLERNGGFDGIADRINMYNHHLKDPGYLSSDITRFRKATADDVQAFAMKYLEKSARVVVSGIPGEQDLGKPVSTTGQVAANDHPESVNAEEDWRAKQPGAGPAPSLAIPAPVSFKLPSGLNVILDYRKGWPVVSAKLVIRGGSGANPVDRPGLANFMLSMLDEGTATRTANQFSDELEQLGARLKPYAAEEYLSLTLTSAKSHIKGGLDLLADATMNPAFPDKEIERERKSILGGLSQDKADASSTANRVMTLALNGEKSPYGYIYLGTEDSVRSVMQPDLRGYWSEHVVPENAALLVSGDLTQEEITAMLGKTFGSWKTGSSKAPDRAAGAVPNSARLTIVDMPGAAQTQLRVAVLGPPRSTSDYESIQVMNAILGGLFSSRINMNLREKHGYSYGARSRFTYLRNTGWFDASSGVRTDVTAPATREVLSEIRKIGGTPVSPEEMKLAKELLVGALPARFQTTEQTVDALTEVVTFDLGLGYYTGYAQKVSGVNEPQVQAVAKKYLIPEKMLVVAVGDRKKIEPEMKALGLGEIQMRDAAGKVVR